ncbi:cysteine dioxygenase family protein [Cytobacillus sp. FSL W7-1323]|uniref:cysteine dioxygenase n=1 Tax=Cytobacillus TaxID=2675230 RepID=UPI0012FE7848|nr:MULTISPECIES: cysteine dioxygenase family protein [Cytobacillus]MDQ0187076.1 cysteine dioxygenase [Cytobacillus kochii]MEA1851590.1 cysteine dioxygenase family protein [Cytobacillus sp. OWB-43]MED1605659.1 cysteine dioxygenase family protein [Cytobacillus kochii]
MTFQEKVRQVLQEKEVPLDKAIRSLNICSKELEPYITQPQGMLEYGRNVIYRNQQVEVIVVYLPPFAKTLVHDHGFSKGEVYVVQGSLLNLIYHKDLSVNKIESYKADESFHVQGDTIHLMFNPTPFEVISFHVYSPPLAHNQTYPAEGRE